jgi:hypothetical protein
LVQFEIDLELKSFVPSSTPGMKQTWSSIGFGLTRYKWMCPSWHQSQSILRVPVNAPPDHLAWKTFRRAGGVESVSKTLAREGYFFAATLFLARPSTFNMNIPQH